MDPGGIGEYRYGPDPSIPYTRNGTGHEAHRNVPAVGVRIPSVPAHPGNRMMRPREMTSVTTSNTTTAPLASSVETPAFVIIQTPAQSPRRTPSTTARPATADRKSTRLN